MAIRLQENNKKKLSEFDWNVLFITSDQHNPKIMGCAGNTIIKTPAIDRLAREGTMFTNAYCCFPACAPTRQSMITGIFPQEHGQISNAGYFDERNKTWAHHFKKFGYTTACIGKMHTNNEWNNHGYDYRYGPLDYNKVIQRRKMPELYQGRVRDEYENEVFGVIKPQRCREMFQAEILNDPSQQRDVVWLNEAKRYLKENKDEKFFLHISFTDPHWPWNTPKEFFYMYDPNDIDLPKILPNDLDDDWLPHKMYYEKGWNDIPEHITRLCRSKYYSSVSYMDSYIDQLLKLLDELDLTRKTLVVYTSDHGDMAGEKGLWFKDMMFDGAVRTPLIFRMPGVVPMGVTCDSLISQVDYFPTIAALVGVADDLSENITGKDMSDAILGKPCNQDFVFCVYKIDPKTLIPAIIMVRSNRWKFIRYDIPNPGKQYVLYDMLNDADEIVNLSYQEGYENIVKEHNTAIDEFLSKMRLTDYPAKTVLQIG